MTVLVIRKHSRFAVCRKARVRPAGGEPVDALLVELSLDGCRIGNVDIAAMENGDQATIEVEGFRPFSGEIRWSGDGSVGLRLARAFHTFELDRLVLACRMQPETSEAMRA